MFAAWYNFCRVHLTLRTTPAVAAGLTDEVWSLENLSDTPSAVDDTPALSLRLEQNVPNPFNPGTTIEYQARAGEHIRLSIYTVRGQRIRTLVDRIAAGGIQRAAWDGRDHSGAPVASGVYVYRLEAASQTLSRKMLLLK